jgi:4'-phosphopantetheinyl transferase
MPVSYIHQDENVYINVWDITEDESFFVEKIDLLIHDLNTDYKQISQGHSRLQYLASRYLLAKMFNHSNKLEIYKSEFGKLYIKDQDINFSISHSEKQVVVAISKYPVGIDIEEKQRDISRIRHKFINTIEDSWVQNAEDILSVWCCKEVVFKIYEKKEVDFLKHITINPLKSNTFEAFFNKKSIEKKYHLQKFNLESSILICGIDFDFVVL